MTSLANNTLLNNDSRIFALCFLKPRRGNPHIEDWLEIYVTKSCRFTELYLKSKLTKDGDLATRQKAEGSFNIIKSEIVYG